jgi:serine/threonine-protein kinase
VEASQRVCSKCGSRYAPDVIFCPKDGCPLGSRHTTGGDDPYLGLQIQGQFRIERSIGIGSMGHVYRAHQTGIERQVAVKILHRDLMDNPMVIGRFHREAKLASQLTHPNLIQILMTGELPQVGADVGGEAYLIMEYLDGISLRSALAASGGAIPLPRALHIILQACDGVGEAHLAGIVHRDLKPENVMLVVRGDDKDFVKVLDFGVARIESADSTVTTQAGAIFGTARYVSPEGARGETVGPPGDVYALATLLFECLAGRTPFDGDSPVAILIQQATEPAPGLRTVPRSSYVPEPIADLIARNLAKDPTARCTSGHDLGRALVEAARASGLCPDDLVARSTLLGGGSTLQLQSIQRTRALELRPEARVALEDSRPSPRVRRPPIVMLCVAIGIALVAWMAVRADERWSPKPTPAASAGQP